MIDEEPLLSVAGAGHRYGDRYGCRDVGFELWPGEVLAVVGESGSGKSTLLGILAQRLSTDEGSVRYRRDGGLVDLAELTEREVRALWRSEWGFVHQNPADGLRMHVSAGGNVGEPLMATGWRHYGRIRGKAAEWLERVEIPADRIDDDPTTFSGSMRQRLQIARNLVVSPRLVFMDEPTSGLDVSAAAAVLNLMKDLGRRLDLTYLIITHNLNVVGYIADRIAVMYLGQIVEVGPGERVLNAPLHPYTVGLLSAVSEPDPTRSDRRKLLVPGEIPSPRNPPPACRFHTRCPLATQICKTETPPLAPIEAGHAVACHHWEQVRAGALAPAAEANAKAE